MLGHIFGIEAAGACNFVDEFTVVIVDAKDFGQSFACLLAAASKLATQADDYFFFEHGLDETLKLCLSVAKLMDFFCSAKYFVQKFCNY